MTIKWYRTKIPGIRYKEHPTRKVGVQKDKYYIIMYQLHGKKKLEAIGWGSHGWTLQKANEILCKLKQNIKLGKHPQTLKEMREMNEKAQKECETEIELNLNELTALSKMLSEFVDNPEMGTLKIKLKKRI